MTFKKKEVKPKEVEIVEEVKPIIEARTMSVIVKETKELKVIKPSEYNSLIHISL